jgi:hypothetical protein
MSIEPHPEIGRDDAAYRAALQRAESLRAYFTHLLVFGVVNVSLFCINVLTRGSDGAWWVVWPLAVWGIVIALHTLVVFGAEFTNDWKLRKADEIYQRRRRDSSRT